MPTNPKLDKLKFMVFEFKETMPVVVALRNKDLKPYHLEDIKRIIGTNIKQNFFIVFKNIEQIKKKIFT